MSLRARLLLGLVVLATIGIVATDVVSYTSLRSFLIERVDETLDDADYSVATALQEPPASDQLVDPVAAQFYFRSALPSLLGSIPGNCMQIRGPDNTVAGSDCLAQFPQRPLPPRPVYPADLGAPAATDTSAGWARYLTVPASEGGGQYRVRISREPVSGSYVLIAAPLVGADGTLHRLLVIELVVGGGVLLGLAVLGFLLVRRGLRPDSSRVGLALGFIVLATIAIGAVNVVNYTSLRTFLFERADQSLDNADYGMSTVLQERPDQLGDPTTVRDFFVSEIPSLVGSIPGHCLQIRTPRNQVVGAQCQARFSQSPIPPDPAYPASVSAPSPNETTGERASYLTVPSTAEGEYRVRVSVEPVSGYYVLVAAPLVVKSALHRLLIIELLVSAGVVFGVAALLGLLLFVRFGLRPGSLRARLTVGLIVLATIGIVTVDVVNYTSLRTYFLERADQSLNAAARSVTVALQEKADYLQDPDPLTVDGFFVGEIPNLVGSIPGNCLQVRTPQDGIVGSDCLAAVRQDPRPPDPVYAERVSVPLEPNADGERVRFQTVPATGGGGQYRVRASVEPFSGYYILIASRLVGVDATLHRLLVIELLVSGGVLMALALLGLWFVRLGLRPLESIGRTATVIAGGDLSRRVEPADEKTEIGRLGLLLNTMLGQIEAAFQSREAALEAREASELKVRRFVADASHELRTPVAAVRAYAELFSHGAVDRPEDLERTMLGVKQASERMSALVDELFLLAHLDEGRALVHEPVDLESVVGEAVAMEQALEPERPVSVETRPTVVIGDRSRLRQLIDNLLSNVRSHTPPGSPVKVSLGHDGVNAVVSVADSGPGIDEASLPHVFERFYRAEAAHTRSGGGTGLGLAIVAALADAHGGSAAVRSDPGEGATFTITIPLAQIDIDDNGDGSAGEPDAEPATFAEH